MAERRMFAKTIIDSDIFLDMPISARLLYYDLAMRADNYGYVRNPKGIQRYTEACDSDMDILCAEGFVIPYEEGAKVLFDLGEIITQRSGKDGRN